MAREQWNNSDELRLKRMYDFCSPCESVISFYRKLHALLALEDKSEKAVEWKCVRMGLEPKVEKKNLRPTVCDHCKKRIFESDRITNGLHKSCYHAKWYAENYKEQK